MRSFENWLTQEVELTFGIRQIKNYPTPYPLLKRWQEADGSFSDHEKETLEKLRLKLLDKADFWNEDELKLQFIGPLLSIVDYGNDEYSAFSQRKLKAKVGDIQLSGTVDFMLARGKQIPYEPFFFLHEYKQERRRNNDPKGQLLAEMIAAQASNQNDQPVYGCFVTGRLWFFMVLNKDEYVVSNAFDATETDLYQITAMLREVKNYALVALQQT